MKNSESEKNSSSVGHELSAASWLDIHYEVARTEYELMLRSVGIKPGDRVLDAGCGGGSFLPLIAELAGTTGRISALDLAPENIAMVEQRIAETNFGCAIETQQGNLCDLPYPDNSFDVVWCANVVQYLKLTEFPKAVSEFYRVLRPGGILGLKEADLTALQISPLPSGMIWRFLEAWRKNDDTVSSLSCLMFPQWLQEVGFTILSRKTYIGEDYHPLSKEQTGLMQGALGFFSQIALKTPGIPEDEKAIWQQKVADLDSPENIMNDPQLYFRRPYTLVIARTPE